MNKLVLRGFRALVFLMGLTATTAYAEKSCHDLTGAWLEVGFVEGMSKDPCFPVVVAGIEGIGGEHPVIKLDRYEISCEGESRVMFGLGPGMEVETGELRFDGTFLHHGGYSAKYEKVSDVALEEYLTMALSCIPEEEQKYSRY